MIEVAAGLVFRGGRVLIAQRRPEDHLGGLWEFPGGKRRAGETFEACLRRELREELDVEVEVEGLLESVNHEYSERVVHLKFYRCRLRTGEPRPIGCQSLAWVTPFELSRYSFPAADAGLLVRLQKTPELWRESSR